MSMVLPENHQLNWTDGMGWSFHESVWWQNNISNAIQLKSRVSLVLFLVPAHHMTILPAHPINTRHQLLQIMRKLSLFFSFLLSHCNWITWQWQAARSFFTVMVFYRGKIATSQMSLSWIQELHEPFYQFFLPRFRFQDWLFGKKKKDVQKIISWALQRFLHFQICIKFLLLRVVVGDK